MKVKESQPLHLLSNPTPNSCNLNLLGTVTHKFNPKLELEAGKAEAIRNRSLDAERERLARKTVELDNSSIPQGKGQKRLIKRRSSCSNNSSISSSIRSTINSTTTITTTGNRSSRTSTPAFTPTNTPPETSPKKHDNPIPASINNNLNMNNNININKINSTSTSTTINTKPVSIPGSAKKVSKNAKDRLSAIMKRRR